MLDNLEELESRFVDLERRIADPEIISNRVQYTKVLKEHGSLTRLIQAYRKFKETRRQRLENEELIAESDGELKEMAEIEGAELVRSEEELMGQLRDLLLTKDDDSDRNAIVEIRAGTGGDEAALFVGDLFRMYQRFAEKRKYKVDVISHCETELGGYREITFSVEGKDVFRVLRYESGCHRVQRVPQTESSGRIHTSAVTVAILPEAEEVEVEIDSNDIRVDTYRASGPGGQHLNKTDSAVRITHLPTQIVVSIQDEKSQHKNRLKAMRVMRSRLYEKKMAEQIAERSRNRKSLIGSGDRSERIRTYNFPQNRVSDHRIHLDVYDLENVMLGSLDRFIDALLEHDRKLQLENLGGDLLSDGGA
ncbi:MAG: peptide chain release factor 1 [Planctomycetota bacterium]|jgi:peptide chain release factor 1|nr:peptide chain release factor 1 [Planctomycetota bacterium]